MSTVTTRKISDTVIQLENKFYISTNSSYADNRIKVLNHSDTFGIFDRWGDITPYGEAVQGIYHCGTRYLSESEFLINGVRPLLLSSSIKEENEILSVDLTNEAFLKNDAKQSIPKGVLHISRSKFFRDARCYEKIEFRNYGGEMYSFDILLSFYGDFKDIFEIRGLKREKRGEIFEIKHVNPNILKLSYRGLDSIVRCTSIQLCRPPDSWEGESNAIYRLSLNPDESHTLEYSLAFENGKSEKVIYNFDQARNKMEAELAESKKEFAQIFTSNEQFNHWINRSHSDMLSLLSQTPDGRYPYAGVPWYNTAFGRDGIITAYETLWVAPCVAKDVLMFLAKNQATEINIFSDSEPGKILHEMRDGEMVETKEIPFKKYYGSIDATPLFIMLAGAYYQRTADIETIKKIWKNICAAIEWINHYGDIDGDGFVEYQYKSQNGLVNQGWKDSFDSISHADGKLAAHPIALCEVQGYVYDAKLQAAMLARVLGEDDLSDRLSKEAIALKKQFHESFWDDELGMYALALDDNKRRCRVRSSNAGHSLFSGIADNKIASQLVKNLLAEDMFCGWGIRTLSSKEKRFNPMSYHNGSVWPHDVAIIATGFARYGFRKEAMQLTAALFDASLFIEQQRLPELFCGFQRRKGEGPTAYPVACSPQAWSVGSLFLFIESCLHMEISAPDKKVLFKKPSMPEFLDNILISGLQLGNERVTLELHRYKDSIGLDVKDNNTGWDIMVTK
jgi:glycogen debranching enzyme